MNSLVGRLGLSVGSTMMKKNFPFIKLDLKIPHFSYQLIKTWASVPKYFFKEKSPSALVKRGAELVNYRRRNPLKATLIKLL